MNDEVAAILDKYEVLSYQTLFAENPKYSKHNMPKDIDSLIKPFVLSEEEKKIKTGIGRTLFYYVCLHVDGVPRFVEHR